MALLPSISILTELYCTGGIKVSPSAYSMTSLGFRLQRDERMHPSHHGGQACCRSSTANVDSLASDVATKLDSLSSAVTMARVDGAARPTARIHSGDSAGGSTSVGHEAPAAVENGQEQLRRHHRHQCAAGRPLAMLPS
jgi:hypothetical protein